MASELRRVHKDWQHPKKDGEYVRLFGGSWSANARRWDARKARWDAGERPDYAGPEHTTLSYEDWDGARPFVDEYMPDWPMAERTHFQLYECVTEGTPVSPVFDSVEAMIRWHADQGEDLASLLRGLESDLNKRERRDAFSADPSARITQQVIDDAWPSEMPELVSALIAERDCLLVSDRRLSVVRKHVFDALNTSQRSRAVSLTLERIWALIEESE